jgi:ribosomal protein L40E
MEATGEPQNPAFPQVQPQQASANQGAYQEQNSGGLLFVIKCIWLFLLGAVLAVVGLFCLIYRPDMGLTNSFIIMLMGLLFTAIGSIYGKRKMVGQTAVADYVVDPAQMLQIRPVDSPPQPQQTQAFPAYPAYPSYPQPAQQRPAETPKIQQPAQPAQAEQPSGIKRIFVCPKCGAENEMDDKFCYKCGFKFTKPKRKSARKAAKTKEKEKPILKSKPVTNPNPIAKKAKPVSKKKIPKETV